MIPLQSIPHFYSPFLQYQGFKVFTIQIKAQIIKPTTKPASNIIHDGGLYFLLPFFTSNSYNIKLYSILLHDWRKRITIDEYHYDFFV